MAAILLRVDEETSVEYENFSPKTKQLLALEVSLMIKKFTCDARTAKLNKLIDDINNDQDPIGISSELLLRFIQVD